MIPILHEDRSPAASLPEGLRDVLESKNLLETGDGGRARVNFCGMVLIKGDLHVFLPRNPAATSPALQQAAITMRALERYTAKSQSSAVFIGRDEGALDLGLLSLARELLEDFIAQGIYIRRTKTNRINSGRPDWGRTIAKSRPIHAADGTPVYAEIHTTASATSQDNLLTLIHASIVRRLGRDFSWWLTGRADTDIAAGLEIFPEPHISADVCISLLRRELGLTYSDREIRLFKNLILYLEQRLQASDGNLIIGLKSFHHCWEHMLRHILPGVINVNSLLPRPAYRLTNGLISPRLKGMVTDIVFREGDTVTVADAKYYRASNPENAPGWGDMVKQFFYGTALKNFMNAVSVRNLFIFPGEGGELVQGLVVDAGQQTALTEDFPPIDCVYLCPIEVMDCYTSSRFIAASRLIN